MAYKNGLYYFSAGMDAIKQNKIEKAQKIVDFKGEVLNSLNQVIRMKALTIRLIVGIVRSIRPLFS